MLKSFFAAGFDPENNANIVFRRRFHYFLITGCFEDENTPPGCFEKK